jgi:hypothetical protein
MAVKATSTTEDLHDEMNKLLQKLNIPILKLVGVVTDGALSMAGNNSCLSTFITTEVDDLFLYHCLIHV